MDKLQEILDQGFQINFKMLMAANPRQVAPMAVYRCEISKDCIRYVGAHSDAERAFLVARAALIGSGLKE